MSGDDAAGEKEPPHGRILRALLVGATFLALAKLAGLGKELAIAWRFGSGPVADAYALTFSLASWPGAVWTSVATVIVVPLMVRAASRGQEHFAELRRELLTASIGLGALLGAAVLGALALGLSLEWFGLTPDRAREAARMAIPLSLMAPATAVSAILAAWLIASHRQLNTLIEGVPSLTLLLVLTAYPGVDGAIIAWATAAGVTLQMLALSVAQGRGEPLFRLTFRFRSDAWPTITRGISVLIVSQVLVSLSGVIDQLSVSSLGPSSNSTIGYASRLILLVQSLASVVIARALLPILANAAYGDAAARWRLTKQWAGILFAASIIGAAAAWLLTPFGVAALFQRGDFTTEDTARVAEAVRFGLLQIPFFCGSVVFAQFVAATGNFRLFLWGNAVNILVKVIANAILIPPLGVPGAMAATAAMYAVSMLVLWGLARRGGGGPKQEDFA